MPFNPWQAREQKTTSYQPGKRRLPLTSKGTEDNLWPKGEKKTTFDHKWNRRRPRTSEESEDNLWPERELKKTSDHQGNRIRPLPTRNQKKTSDQQGNRRRPLIIKGTKYDLWPAREQKKTSDQQGNRTRPLTSTLCGCSWIMLGTRAGYIRDNLGDFTSKSLLLYLSLLAGDRLAGPMGWCHSVTPTQPLIHLTLQLSSGGLCHWRTAGHFIFFITSFTSGHGNFHPPPPPSVLCDACGGTPLDSETGWTGEHRLQTNLLK